MPALPSDPLVVLLILALAGMTLITTAALRATLRLAADRLRAETTARTYISRCAALAMALAEVKLAAEAPTPTPETITHIHSTATRALLAHERQFPNG